MVNKETQTGRQRKEESDKKTDIGTRNRRQKIVRHDRNRGIATEQGKKYIGRHRGRARELELNRYITQTNNTLGRTDQDIENYAFLTRKTEKPTTLTVCGNLKIQSLVYKGG